MPHHSASSARELQSILRLAKSGPVIVRFFRPGCPACDSIVGAWNDFVRLPQNAQRHFVSINVSDAQELAREMGIESIPTFVRFQSGRAAEISVGANMNAVKRMASH